MRRWWKGKPYEDTITVLASSGRQVEPGSQEGYELGLHGCVTIDAGTHGLYSPDEVQVILDPETQEIIGYLVRRR